MTCGSYLVEALHARGFRMTPQREVILHVLRSAGGHLAAGEVVQRACREYPGLNKATVYRTLESLARHGLVQAVHLGGDQVAYELSDQPHHHVICRTCGREVVLSNQVLGTIYTAIKAASGYEIDPTHLVWHGICPDCQ